MNLIHVYNKLTSLHPDPSLNFLESLSFRDSGLKLSKVLRELSSNNVEFEITKGFNFKSENEFERTFRIATIRINNEDLNLKILKKYLQIFDFCVIIEEDKNEKLYVIEINL